MVNGREAKSQWTLSPGTNDPPLLVRPQIAVSPATAQHTDIAARFVPATLALSVAGGRRGASFGGRRDTGGHVTSGLAGVPHLYPHEERHSPRKLQSSPVSTPLCGLQRCLSPHTRVSRVQLMRPKDLQHKHKNHRTNAFAVPTKGQPPGRGLTCNRRLVLMKPEDLSGVRRGRHAAERGPHRVRQPYWGLAATLRGSAPADAPVAIGRL